MPTHHGQTSSRPSLLIILGWAGLAACSTGDDRVPQARGPGATIATSGAVRPAYFFRAGAHVAVRRTSDGFTVELPEGTENRQGSALPGEIGRHGRLALVESQPGVSEEALSARGRVLPTVVTADGPRPRFATPYLYVRPAGGTAPATLQAWLARTGLTRVGTLYLEDWVYVRSERDPVETARALVESGEATAAEPSFFVGTTLHGLPPLSPGDPYFAEQWQLHNDGPFTSADGKGVIRGGDHAHVAEAWQLLTRMGKATGVASIGEAVRLAVVDDGFDIAHEDLADKIVASKNFGGPVEPGNMFRATSPRDFHGTLVTGIAAASAGNGVGVAGACPGCRIIAARMGSDTPAGTTPDQYYDGIFGWVMGQSPDVVNCSWGPDAAVAGSYYDALVQRITTTGRGGKGTILVFASGNAGEDMAWNRLASHPRSITVGASDSKGVRFSFSNFGAGLDLLAPSSGGEKSSGFGATQYFDRIWSTDNYLRPACLGSGAAPSSGCSDTAGWTPSSPMAGGDGWNGKYAFRFSHTSAAAPLVSGIVGLMLHANPALTADEVQTILHETADRVSSASAKYDATGFSPQYGYGRVNALRAVARAIELGGVILNAATRADIDAVSPCTRPECGGAASVDAGSPPSQDGNSGRPESGTAPGGSSSPTGAGGGGESTDRTSEPAGTGNDNVPGRSERSAETDDQVSPGGAPTTGCSMIGLEGQHAASQGALTWVGLAAAFGALGTRRRRPVPH